MPSATLNPTLREWVSFSSLAEDILGLSRARLYELVDRGAMPQPCYDLRTKRPIFTRNQQEQALAVLRLGVGIDGQPIIFYRRAQRPVQPTSTSARSRPRTSNSAGSGRYIDLITSLQSLGVSTANDQAVTAAMALCYPSGTAGQQDSDILRVIFRHLRRQESA